VNLIGAHIGSYVVERELGAGGAGTVYACRHTMIDREVAVKVLHDEHVKDPDQVARFFQEAKAAADIGHPNIIVIIDYGALPVPGGSRTYVMMESLEGESLDKRMRRGGLSSDDILHIFSQIASALVACHGKGIIHRDLKPSNIFLCHRSFDPLFVKVLDFGTAKLTAPAPDMRRTQYGVVIGTPAYMSPEQCEGKGAIDHRSDIYSLGVMLYEMLTGRLPFDADTPWAWATQHMTAQPIPFEVSAPAKHLPDGMRVPVGASARREGHARGAQARGRLRREHLLVRNPNNKFNPNNRAAIKTEFVEDRRCP
jgi:serine/threonine-protein kinase